MRRRRALRAGLAGLVLCAAGLMWVLLVPFERAWLSPENITSVVLEDRRGAPLREVLSAREGRAQWVGLADVSPWLIVATQHAEDQRFWTHGGLDVSAIARAARVNAAAGRVVMGASTISQQVVKMLTRGTRGRTLGTKLDEAVWTFRLERALSKVEIFEQYVNRVPYGNQLYGISAASWMYFDKPPEHLTLAESTFLAVIPRSPGRLDPYRRFEQVQAAQRVLLGALRARGAIDEATWRRAVDEPLRLVPRRGRVEAAHFTDEVLRRLPAGLAPQRVRTTLDLVLQRQVEGIVGEALRRLDAGGREVGQAAVVVLDTRSGEVLAWVGSGGYWDVAEEGANDGVLALRQPGSALKPFVYELYFEQGGAPGEVLLDGPVQFSTAQGVYVPKNYDQRFHGPVTAREALGSSLNIPAVLVAREVGVDALLARLRALGFGTLTEDADHYGLALALGDGEVRLLDLVNAYATLGRLGERRAERVWEGEATGEAARVMGAAQSYQVLDILADDDARGVGFGRRGVLSLPFRVAIKTGTSASYRDNWAVAVGPEVTVGVWAGNFDGQPMAQSSGVVGAAPILRRVLQTIYPRAAGPGDVRWFEAPEGVEEKRRLCMMSGHVAGPLCERVGRDWSRAGAAERCAMHERVEVDVRNGQLAGPGCGEAVREARLGHRVPAGWMEWASAHEVVTLPRESSPLCGGAEEGGAVAGEVQLVHPLEGDVFYMTPEGGEVAFKAQVRGAGAGEALTWYVDGREIARVKAPFVARWRLAPGSHRVGAGRGRIEVERVIEVR